MEESPQAGRGRPTEARIDLGALGRNAREARRLADGRQVIAVVKADAYGHGALPCVRALLEAGCAQLAVISVDEAETLRSGGVRAPILVMGGLHDPDEARRARALGLTPVLHGPEDRELAEKAAGSGPAWAVQVEVDTGMRRRGVAVDDALDFLADVVAPSPGLSLQGVFTHLARADEPDLLPSRRQLERFRALLQGLDARGLRPPRVHVANSAGLLAASELAGLLPEATDVRPGLLLYGVAPAPHLTDRAALEPVMSLCSQVAQVVAVGEGEGVGYGATWRAPAPTRVATLPAGYADGIPWRSAGEGGLRVWLAGALRPVIGRISMDYVAVHVGDAAVRRGDAALHFGRVGSAEYRVEQAARDAGTLSYELLVRVGPRVPRRLV